jgi:hypothetical protein
MSEKSATYIGGEIKDIDDLPMNSLITSNKKS